MTTSHRVKISDEFSNLSSHTTHTVRTHISSATSQTSGRSRAYHGIYLPNSHAMRATQSSLALVSLVLSFDIVELWSNCDDDGELRCVYAHVTQELQVLYPNIIAGHYPEHKRKDHSISPNLCRKAKAAPEKYYWNTQSLEAKDRKTTSQSMNGLPPLEEILTTQVSYLLDNTEDVDVFIVAFAKDAIAYKNSKLKFLSGLGYAIYIAAFDLDDDGESEGAPGSEELDLKDRNGGRQMSFDGLVTHLSSINLVGLTSPEGGERWARSTSKDYLLTNGAGNVAASSADGQDDVRGSEDMGIFIERSDEDLSALGKKNAQSHVVPTRRESKETIPAKFAPAIPRNGSGLMYEFTEPPFSYPVISIPVAVTTRDNLTLADFTNAKHIADGSNANVFVASFKGTRVIIKMIKEEVAFEPVAVHEFDVEQGILARVNHPHIIKLLGSGKIPRRFIVLEYLEGGSLDTILSQNQAKPGFAQKLFRRPTFTYENLLMRAKQMADALDFLHSRCHPGASIIHRDLKPDNVGFDANGNLKIYDFGLCTCVKSRSSNSETYELTGNTGSLRYMAPEVAQKKPYSEKVDVYSFGIMLWQMARDRVPFKGMNRDEFHKRVVMGTDRPKLDKAWPKGFSDLLTKCWHKDHELRPSFKEIVQRLDSLMPSSAIGNRSTWGGRRGRGVNQDGTVTSISEDSESTKSTTVSLQSSTSTKSTSASKPLSTWF